MTNEKLLKQFDDWLRDDSSVAALVMRQWLMPAEGKDAVIFPPTYPIEQNRSGYNVDRFEHDGSSVCQIDSVGSQANRMEPIFKRDPYSKLVPQLIIKAGAREVQLLDAGHRGADAIVRFSEVGPELHEAFRMYRDEGNAIPLAKIAPTSIVFGSWDSRATQAKLPRIVRSVIRAFNVKEMHRSAQYTTIAGEILEEGEAEVTTKGPKAELGLAHVPAVLAHGGIQVSGDIRRDAILNLEATRAIGGLDTQDTLLLRRYVLGLALVSFTARSETFLRQGCELVPDPDHSTEWHLVKHDGAREKLSITHDSALEFATAAASAFKVPQQVRVAEFDSALANAVMQLGEQDRKRLLKQGPVTKKALEQLKKAPKSRKKDE